MKTTMLFRLGAVALAALAFAVGTRAEEKENLTQPDVNYQAGGSPLGAEPMYQNTNPKAPAMTLAEFELARKPYFERCAQQPVNHVLGFVAQASGHECGRNARQ